MNTNKEMVQRKLDYLDKVINTFNSNNRAVIVDKEVYEDDFEHCVYRPTDKSPGCAIGMELTKEEYKPEFESKSVGLIFNDLPERLKELGKDFLGKMQFLHDSGELWTETGFNYKSGQYYIDRYKEMIMDGRI